MLKAREKAMKVEVLYTRGCPSYRKAREVVEEVLKEEGVEARVELVPVESREEAERLNFPGSPTVRVEGRDVEESQDYGLVCRYYFTSRGVIPYPPREKVREAVREAGG